MITYKIDVLSELKSRGYNTNVLRKNRWLAERTIQQLRRNELVSYLNLERLCVMLECQPGDILEFVPSEKKKAPSD